MQSIVKLSAGYAECHYDEYRYAKYHGALQVLCLLFITRRSKQVS
jgi:hypothetical protein